MCLKMSVFVNFVVCFEQERRKMGNSFNKMCMKIWTLRLHEIRGKSDLLNDNTQKYNFPASVNQILKFKQKQLKCRATERGRWGP